MRYWHSLKIFILRQIIMNDKGECGHFRVEKPSGFHLTSATKVNISDDKTCRHHIPPDVTCWERHAASVVSSLTAHDFGLLVRKHQTDPNEGASTRWLTSTLKKSQGDERLKNCPRWEEIEKTWQLPVPWDPGVEPGTGNTYRIRGKERLHWVSVAPGLCSFSGWYYSHGETGWRGRRALNRLCNASVTLNWPQNREIKRGLL